MQTLRPRARHLYRSCRELDRSWRARRTPPSVAPLLLAGFVACPSAGGERRELHVPVPRHSARDGRRRRLQWRGDNRRQCPARGSRERRGTERGSRAGAAQARARCPARSPRPAPFRPRARARSADHSRAPHRARGTRDAVRPARSARRPIRNPEPRTVPSYGCGRHGHLAAPTADAATRAGCSAFRATRHVPARVVENSSV